MQFFHTLRYSSIFNEWYLRDQSRKVSTAYRIKGSSGKPITNSAIYGYKKDPNDKDHWIIDEEAAAVVRRIFKLAVEGYGPFDIAKMLTAEKVESPGYYLSTHGRGMWKSLMDYNRPHDWYGATVASMLAKPEYMGHTVNFRSSQKSYKDKRVDNDPSEWMIFENTHEAIVDRETWELVQGLRKTRRRIGIDGEPNAFAGLMYCADCGSKMYAHRNRAERTDGTAYIKEHYNCSKYTLSKHREHRECTTHAISDNALRPLVMDAIRTVGKYAIENEDAFIQRVRELSVVRQEEAAKDLKRKIKKDTKRVAELDVLIKKLYESYAMGRMPEKRYEMLSAEYEQEQAELIESVTTEQAELDAYESDTQRVDQFLALAKKYRDVEELTTPMINEFIDKIVVHAPTKDEYGERNQEIEIYLKFIGKFDIPVSEPTPEDLAELERQRERRAAYRKKYERRKEREQLIKAGVATKRVPYPHTCKFCGGTFMAMRVDAMFCNSACRTKHYHREKRRQAEEAAAMQKSDNQETISA